MNCPQARERLAARLYEDLAPEDAVPLDRHLAECPACRREAEALRRVHELLDSLPAPAARVDLPALYRQAALRHERQARRWRRGAIALLGAAAVLLLIFGLRLEIRVEPHQATFRWGMPADPDWPVPRPVRPSPDPLPSVANDALAAVTPEQMLVCRELIHALAADVDRRDGRLREEVARLQELYRRTGGRLAETERQLAAIHAAQMILIQKGGER